MWCKLITYVHFVFSVTIVTKYCNWKVYNEKFLWRISPQIRETWEIPIIHKCSHYSLFYHGNSPWLEIKSKISGKPKNLSILIHWSSLCFIRFFAYKWIWESYSLKTIFKVCRVIWNDAFGHLEHNFPILHFHSWKN